MATKQTVRNRINKTLQAIGSYAQEIPLDEIFSAVKAQGGLPVQEDGTEWAGLLCGAEGRANFRVVFADMSDMYLFLSWYKMDTRDGGYRYEIVTYVS